MKGKFDTKCGLLPCRYCLVLLPCSNCLVVGNCTSRSRSWKLFTSGSFQLFFEAKYHGSNQKRIFKDPVADDTRTNGTECKAYLNLSFHAGHNHEELINKTFNFSYNPIFYVCRYFALWLLETIFSIIGKFPTFGAISMTARDAFELLLKL